MRLLVPLLTSTGLLGGFASARYSGSRPLGGAVLAALGAATFAVTRRSAGTGRAAALTALYLAAFGGSHPLAKRLGPWGSVGAVSGATAVAGALLTRP